MTRSELQDALSKHRNWAVTSWVGWVARAGHWQHLPDAARKRSRQHAGVGHLARDFGLWTGLITYVDTYLGSRVTKEENSLAQSPPSVSANQAPACGGREESQLGLLFGLIQDRTHPMIYRRPRILNELNLCLQLRASPGAQLLSIKNTCWLCLFWTICLSSVWRFS